LSEILTVATIAGSTLLLPLTREGRPSKDARRQLRPTGRSLVTETDAQRIAREEAYWNAPRLFGFGLVFLAACIVFIYVMSSI
jgi:hypothetical protein